jgi:hypothetical protein
MRKPPIDLSKPASKTRLAWWGEGLGLVALCGLTAFFLATSWRKWPEPLVDFGRELYLPWRLANGAVLYRDADDFYGPLSQYFNAALFRLFGPGLMVLVTANLAVFAAIFVSLYALFRRAWGVPAALVSCAVFVAVFGFSQFVGGNHNFATPYSHEATHGFLICLLLLVILVRWLENPTLILAALAGGLFGLTAVLKPEIMLAAGLVTAAAVAIGRLRPKPAPFYSLGIWLVMAALPTLAFWVYFSAAHLPSKEGLMLASRAWLSVTVTTRFTSDFIQSSFLGLDQPWRHLLEHGIATVLAILFIGGIAGVAWSIDRIPPPAKILAGAVFAGSVGWLAWDKIKWIDTGRCVLGLALIYIASGYASTVRRAKTGVDLSRPRSRWLIAVLAAGLMARMLLNGRIYQFGFYQAALGTLLIPAVLIGELPEKLKLGRWGRMAFVGASLIAVGVGVFRLAAQSQNLLRLKTYAVGEGIDRFYTLPPQLEPTGELVNNVSEFLRQMPGNRTLLVLPEGEMINYLTRLPSPVAPFFLFSAATHDGREKIIVEQLQQHAPDWVVVISRDLREYGVARYGESQGQGRSILEWTSSHYRLAAAFGGDPLDVRRRGAVVLKHQR